MTLGLHRIASALGSLKLRITLGGVAALVLAVGLNMLFLAGSGERETLNAARSRELGETVHTAKVLGQRISDLQRGLKAFSSQLDPDTVADPTRLERLVESKLVLRGMFATLFVATPDGKVLVYVDDSGLHRVAFGLGDRAYFRRTLAEKTAVVSEPVPGRLSGEPVIVFTQPLQHEGAVHAVLGGSVRLSGKGFLADLVEQAEGDASVLVAVTDGDGRVLAHPNRSRTMQPIADEARLDEATVAWRTTRGATTDPTRSLPETGQLVSLAGVPGSDWLVWRARSEEDLLAPLRSARQDAIGWAVALVALLSAALFVTLWWLFEPLALLETRAQHLFDGQLDAQEGWPSSGGEIGRLGRVLRHVGAERAQLETFNAQVLRKLGSVMSAAPIGIAFTLNNRFELLSRQFCLLTGRGEHELMGQPMHLIFVSNEDHRALDAQAQQAFAAGQPYSGEWQMLRADGTRFWARLRGGPVDASDISLGAIWTLNDISEQMIKREELQWSATHDPLTGLANRKGFGQRAEALFASAPRSLPAAVVFIDLDHFKPINDEAGHAAGDAMLRAVSAAMASQVRTSDLVARLGGDEFALLLERCTHEVAMRVAEDVRAAICAIALPWEQGVLTVGASLGVASLSADTVDVDAWVQAADAACYSAKGAGRGTVRVAPEPALRLVVARAEVG